MYYCEQCGTAYDAEAAGNFCKNCGAPRRAGTLVKTSDALEAIVADTQQTPQLSSGPQDASKTDAVPSPAANGPFGVDAHRSDAASSADGGKPDMICPKCGGRNFKISHEIVRKGYGGGKACCGSLVLGPFGLLCGLCGKDKVKAENVYWICETCGNTFTAQVKDTVAADGTKTSETRHGKVPADETDDSSWKTGWSAVLKPKNIGAAIAAFIALIVLQNTCEYGAFDLFATTLNYNLFDRYDVPSFIKSFLIFSFVVGIPFGVADAILEKLSHGKKIKGLTYLLFFVFYAIRFCDIERYYVTWLPILIPLGGIALGCLGMAGEALGILRPEDEKRNADAHENKQ
jgi:Zn finger protein HypA/HybF involved in hydrogenase expression